LRGAAPYRLLSGFGAFPVSNASFPFLLSDIAANPESNISASYQKVTIGVTLGEQKGRPFRTAPYKYCKTCRLVVVTDVQAVKVEGEGLIFNKIALIEVNEEVDTSAPGTV